MAFTPSFPSALGAVNCPATPDNVPRAAREGRNMFEPEKMRELKFTYYSIGRKPVLSPE
jgi:hypothetical protein